MYTVQYTVSQDFSTPIILRVRLYLGPVWTGSSGFAIFNFYVRDDILHHMSTLYVREVNVYADTLVVDGYRL